MELYYAPENYIKNKYTIFLAGTIDMDNSYNWQSEIIKDLSDQDVILLNPRRKSFNKDAVQSIEDEYFRNQVEWELKGLEESDLIIIHFLPDSLSPISLLELGLNTDIRNISKNNRIIVCCPGGFWRKGNIEIVCNRYGVDLCFDYSTLISKILIKIENQK